MSIDSIGTDFNDDHAFGIACPLSIPAGEYTLLVSTLSSSPQSFGIRYSTESASLNDGTVISETLCCRGNNPRIYKQYFLDVPADSTEVNIFVSRTSDTVTPDFDRNRLVINHNTCIEGGQISTFDYAFDLPDNGDTALTINQNSNPPLIPGSRLLIAHYRSGLSIDATDSYVLSTCVQQGCNPEPTGIFGQSSDAGTIDTKFPKNFIFLAMFLNFVF